MGCGFRNALLGNFTLVQTKPHSVHLHKPRWYSPLYT